MTDELHNFRKYFRVAALGCSVASAWLTLLFGFQQSPHWYVAMACAAFFVVCSLASDYIMLFVVDAWRRKSWGFVAAFGLGAVMVFSLNLMSNMGSVGWQRDTTAMQARVQNTRADLVADTAKGSASRLAFLEAELVKLPWTPVISSDALVAKDEAIRQESRRGGCGPKCLKLKEERAAIAGQIGTAEKRADLDKQIAELREVVKAERERVMSTDRVTAAPVSQATFFAGLVSFSLQPTETAEAWTDRGIASWIALGLCICPMLFSLIGWRTGAAPFAAPVPAGPASAPTELGPSARPETPPAPMPVKVAQRIPSGLEGLRAFLEDVNRHARRIGAPEYKGAV